MDPSDLCNLTSSTVLVAGASRRLGAAIALGLADAGADLALVDHPERSCARLQEEVHQRGRVSTHYAWDPLDPSRPEEIVAHVVASREPLRGVVIVNQACRERATWELTSDEWDGQVRLVLDGAFHLAQAVARQFRRQRSGRLVFVTCTDAFTGQPGHAACAAAQGGLQGLARTLARELAPAGATVNTVLHGPLAGAPGEAPARGDSGLLALPPLGGGGDPDEVAAAVVYLLAPAARHMTGARLRLDGGLTLGLK